MRPGSRRGRQRPLQAPASRWYSLLRRGTRARRARQVIADSPCWGIGVVFRVLLRLPHQEHARGEPVRFRPLR